MEYLAAEPVKGSTVAFSDKTIAKALANIYRKRVNVKTEIEPELFLETVHIFNLAAATGISDAVDAGTAMPDDDFLQAIKTNNEVFAAFRTHKMQNDIAAMMTDGDGKLKSFSKFAKDVEPYTDHKNRAWLQTEYNTAVLRAHQAADWKQFEREKDVLPNLEWMPSTSTHPGEDHRPFWGTILPMDDPFWNEHRPGDRWNCKCRLRNTDKEATDVPTGGSHDMPQRGLENNPGKDGKLFSGKHPYMPQSCSACPFGHGKLWALAAGKGKNCGQCGRLEKAEGKANGKDNITKAKQEYDSYNPDVYAKTFFDTKTGGYVVTDRQRITAAKKIKQEGEKYEKEREMSLVFAKGGNKIVHRREVPGVSSADVLFNGLPADLKKTNSYDQIVKYAKYATHKQGAKLVLFQFDKWNAKIAKEIKNLNDLKIHGKYFVTGKEDEIIDF